MGRNYFLVSGLLTNHSERVKRIGKRTPHNMKFGDAAIRPLKGESNPYMEKRMVAVANIIEEISH